MMHTRASAYQRDRPRLRLGCRGRFRELEEEEQRQRGDGTSGSPRLHAHTLNYFNSKPRSSLRIPLAREAEDSVVIILGRASRYVVGQFPSA